MDELTAWLTLARAPGLHSSHLTALLGRFGAVTAAVNAPAAALRECGASPAVVDWLRSSHRAGLVDQDRRWLDRERHHFVHWGCAEYPRLLAEVTDAPVGLFVRGSPTALLLPQLAVVG